MSTIKLEPHPNPALLRQIMAIIERGEGRLWIAQLHNSTNWVRLDAGNCFAIPNTTKLPIPNTDHPHRVLWDEWQGLVKSGAVERGEAWIDFDGGKTELCEWRADTEYRIVRKEPKLKLIDWANMPRGVMTTFGEIVMSDCRNGDSCVLSEKTTKTFWYPYASLRLAPADEQPWIVWMGGECPVPEGVQAHVIVRNTNRVVLTKPGQLNWRHDGTDNDFIAYRVTSIAPGWTDDPKKAK